MFRKRRRGTFVHRPTFVVEYRGDEGFQTGSRILLDRVLLMNLYDSGPLRSRVPQRRVRSKMSTSLTPDLPLSLNGFHGRFDISTILSWTRVEGQVTRTTRRPTLDRKDLGQTCTSPSTVDSGCLPRDDPRPWVLPPRDSPPLPVHGLGWYVSLRLLKH